MIHPLPPNIALPAPHTWAAAGSWKQDLKGWEADPRHLPELGPGTRHVGHKGSCDCG